MINLRNGSVQIQEGSFIFDIPYFNQEVIREALNNAVAHRDYNRTSEIVVKQSPYTLDVVSPGGFPIGVTIDNIISVSSTPRNRLLTDILQKTGIVERSGQGVDKIYYKTLKEGKPIPRYDRSDDYQVELNLSAMVQDKAFALFIESVQENLDDEDKLSVQEVICLSQIKEEKCKVNSNNKAVVAKLLMRGLIEKRGKTRAIHYILSKEYYEFSDEKGKYSRTLIDKNQAFLIILQHLQKFETAKMQDFVDLFKGNLTRKQVRRIVKLLVQGDELKQKGRGRGTYYVIGDNFIASMDYIMKALNIGISQLEKDKIVD